MHPLRLARQHGAHPVMVRTKCGHNRYPANQLALSLQSEGGTAIA
jgi:hypothetical protein